MLSMSIIFMLFGANIDEFLLAAASGCSWGFADRRCVTHNHRPPLVGTLVHSVPAHRSGFCAEGHMEELAEEVSVGGSSEAEGSPRASAGLRRPG